MVFSPFAFDCGFIVVFCVRLVNAVLNFAGWIPAFHSAANGTNFVFLHILPLIS